MPGGRPANSPAGIRNSSPASFSASSIDANPSKPTTGLAFMKNTDRTTRASASAPRRTITRLPGANRCSGKSVSAFRITSPRRPCGRATRATTTRSSQASI